MSPLELSAAALGVVNIVLVARRTVANYPFGIVTVVLYAIVFARARLYSAAGLQAFFLASQLYGWWYWRRSGTGPVRSLPPATAGCSSPPPQAAPGRSSSASP